MDILEQIIHHKKKEVAERKNLYPVKLLEQSIFFSRQVISLKRALKENSRSGIIAEFKRQSPSKGVINADADVLQTTKGYVVAGATALSVLTDKDFFGGSNVDLIGARSVNQCPILRKDFIVDEYQVVEAKSIGADVILLIAAGLSPEKLQTLAKFARSLHLEVLLEVHSAPELEANLSSNIDLVGVNNRDLKTFEVNLGLSRELSTLIPNEFIKISESGIAYPEAVVELRKFGYEGFLMGENFMKHDRPELAAKEFIELL
ncbi:MAG TPA: indole-3-glycerol phosphate synthase TrpC [Cyclobacteriaceae bacterium]|nr:indole-3-glycerol phosphate synthase TrpC [Cyclobacteriaceae bacterium]